MVEAPSFVAKRTKLPALHLTFRLTSRTDLQLRTQCPNPAPNPFGSIT